MNIVETVQFWCQKCNLKISGLFEKETLNVKVVGRKLLNLYFSQNKLFRKLAKSSCASFRSSVEV